MRYRKQSRFDRKGIRRSRVKRWRGSLLAETVAHVPQISAARDEQATSAEEIAAIVDQERDQSRKVADEIEDVAASTEEQAASIGEIEQSADRLQS